MLLRLAKALAQLKADTNLENLLIEIRQIAYSLYQSTKKKKKKKKKIAKRAHNNIIKSIEV